MSGRIRTVVHVAREYGEFVGAGGVKDNTRGLCTASAEAGVATHVFLPHPRDASALGELSGPASASDFEVAMHAGPERVSVRRYETPGRPNLVFHFVKSRRFEFLPDAGGGVGRRAVYTYTEEEAAQIGRPDLAGKRYHDNFEMNVLLVKSALHALGGAGPRPDLIHCHDGHTGLVPLLAQHSADGFAPFLGTTPALLTLHNAADRYRGELVYSDLVPAATGVPGFILKAFLHNGQFDPVLAAAMCGAAVNTISENYARELQETSLDYTTSWLGHRLAGYGIRIRGITSGIDPRDFNPEDPARMGTAAAFSPRRNEFAGKRACKAALLEELGFRGASVETPVLTFVGRLVHQKGYDFLVEAAAALFAEDADVLLVGNGSGSKDVVEMLKGLEARFPARVRVDVSYDTRLANRVFAAGDFCLIPSRFEPCGLVDFIAQLFGNLPVVHAVGGLVKVLDGETGFSYVGGERELLAKTREALALYRNDPGRLREMQLNAVSNIFRHFTWERVFARKYLPLYEEVAERSGPALPYDRP